jgi:tRNA G10  N-methylase Trm11
MEELRPRLNLLEGDARKPPNGLSFDVVITDPPYGFNNDINMLELADLLTKSFDAIFDSLKPTSQLVIALPDHSHSGKHIPLFATRVWVTEQIIAKADKHGFEAVVPAQILPRLGNLFQAPYYWNSEKALKRVILHFQFRKKRPGKGRL